MKEKVISFRKKDFLVLFAIIISATTISTFMGTYIFAASNVDKLLSKGGSSLESQGCIKYVDDNGETVILNADDIKLVADAAKQLNETKQDKLSADSSLTADRVLALDNDKNVTSTSITTAQLSTLAGINNKNQLVNGTIQGQLNHLGNQMGSVSALNTTAKDNLVKAVNELKANIDANFRFSTDEQVAGKWIDGKTIYSKTLELGNLTKYGIVYNGTMQIAEIDTSSLKIDKMIDMKIKVFGTDAGGTTLLNSIYTFSTIDDPNHALLTSWYRQGTKLLTIRVGSQYTEARSSGAEFVATIYYTKQ